MPREKIVIFISDLLLLWVCESTPKINARKGNQMTKIIFSESNSNNCLKLRVSKADRRAVPAAQESSVLFALCSQGPEKPPSVNHTPFRHTLEAPNRTLLLSDGVTAKKQCSSFLGFF